MLQTKKGNAAKGVTQEEWKDFMLALKAKLAAELAKPEQRAAWRKATGGTPEHCPPIFSFDNPTIHTDPDNMAELGIVDDVSRQVLPPYSPDLHRVIERVHARVCQRFQKWVNADTQSYCMEGYCQALEYVFWKSEKPSIISADLEKIHLLYEKVIELHGNRAPRPFC